MLLRSGWQSVNIGDITHTPGALTLIEKAMPDASVILWPGEIERGVEPMLQRRFPRLSVAKGSLDGSGAPNTPELREAIIAARVLEVVGNPKQAARTVADAVAFARRKQAEAMAFVKTVAEA